MVLIIRDFQILMNHIGKPGEIVGNMGAHAAARGGMPPMLHIAFLKLAGGGAQNMVAREIPPRHQERHHILQLIAKPVSAARLIKRGAGPQPAGQRLIQKPAVEHKVHRAVGRPDLDGAQVGVPLPLHVGQERFHIRGAVAPDQTQRVFTIRRLVPTKIK